jgi:hypothetical protein
MITRRETFGAFLGSAIALLGIGALPACSPTDSGDDDGGDPDAGSGSGSAGATADAGLDAPPSSTQCTTAAYAIGSNHGHTLVVADADITAGVDKSYNIQGTATHPHTVVVTAAMFTMLKTARSISITSTTNASHSHPVTVTC